MGSARRMAVPGSPKSRKQAHTSATVRDILASREEICCRTLVLKIKMICWDRIFNLVMLRFANLDCFKKFEDVLTVLHRTT